MPSLLHIGSGFLALLCAAGGTAAADDAIPQPADTFLQPPKAANITAFANDVKLPRDFKGVAITVDKEKVMEFFASGEVKPADKDRAHWRTLADFTLPDALANDPILQAAQKASAQIPNGRVFFNAYIHTGGVVAANATIYFWHLWNDRVLELDDEAGRSCLLVLGADAKPLASSVHPFGEFDGAKEAEKKLYGKLTPVPLAKDITAFCNRPENAYEDGRRNYLSRERADGYLTAASSMARNCPLLVKFDGSLDPFKSDANAAYMKNGGDPYLRARMDGAEPGDTVTDGVLIARDGRLIFWRMGADGIFYFMDDHHRTNCVASNMAGDCARRISAAFEQFTMAGAPRCSLVTYNEITGGDDWKPYQPPPLAREKAVRNAWGMLQRSVDNKDPAAWRVSRVATTRFTAYEMTKWYYTVYFVKQDAPEAAVPVLVSMNGTAGGVYAAGVASNKMTEAQGQYNEDIQKRVRRFGGGIGFGGGGFGVLRD